ncbi:MAG: choice-of-anchor tandem repeat GloVer-containing protein [Verrucomicrobiota bacterium]
MAALAMCLLAEAAHAQSFSVIYTFTNSPGAGNQNSSLLLESNTLYGTTYYGGSSSNGTVFKVNTDGSGYTILKSFSARSANYPYTNTDGVWPQAGLVLSNSILYGTTMNGGLYGGGTVFKIQTDGSNFVTLKNFLFSGGGASTDASNPQAGLVLAENTLYGTSYYGGTNGNGTVFKVNTDSSGFAILKHFSATILNTNFGAYVNGDGAIPYSGLALNGGALYGTTSRGGSFGYGTVFMLNTDGSSFAVLKNFPRSFSSGGGSGINDDGMYPIGGLICQNNVLYGTTMGGGTNGWGTVFKISIYGDGYSVIKSFANIPDGSYPQSTLVLSGNTLYGTTVSGGVTGNGTLFKVNLDGTGYSILKNFPATVSDTNNDGGLNWSMAGLTLNGGTFYGTASVGGAYGSGTVFKLDLTPQLGAILFSNSIPQVAITNFFGQSVDIQVATNLSGTWEVLTNLVLTNGIGQFSDSSSTNFPQRFYRALAQ